MSHARILVVDDEPFARQTLSEWLRGINFTSSKPKTAGKPWKTIGKDQSDIVISDVVMPGMDGIHLLKEAKAVKTNLPII